MIVEFMPVSMVVVIPLKQHGETKRFLCEVAPLLWESDLVQLTEIKVRAEAAEIRFAVMRRRGPMTGTGEMMEVTLEDQLDEIEQKLIARGLPGRNEWDL